jgi:hypothetical protein
MYGIKTLLQQLIRLHEHLHTVSTDDIQSQIILHDALIFRKHSLVALFQYQVHRLVVAFQAPLKINAKALTLGEKHHCNINDLTTIFLPSLVITLTVSKKMQI